MPSAAEQGRVQLLTVDAELAVFLGSTGTLRLFICSVYQVLPLPTFTGCAHDTVFSWPVSGRWSLFSNLPHSFQLLAEGKTRSGVRKAFCPCLFSVS